MAKIVDPDSLNIIIDAAGTSEEVRVNTTTKTIELRVLGALDDNSPGSTSGVTMQALYSFLKEEWQTQAALNKFRFPLKSFTKNEFQWINGWAPENAQTRQLVRDAGWQETVAPSNGDLYAGFISLGNFDNVADQGYYAQEAGLNPTVTPNFDKTGNVNEAVLVFDADGSDLTGYFKAFLREQGKLYSSYDLLTEQTLSALEATLYRFPLSNESDLNANSSDAYIDADAVVTFTNATNIVNYTSHPFVDGDKIQFELNGGTVPAELSAGTTYYVVTANANDFQVAATLGGPAITFTDDGTATVNVIADPFNGMTLRYYGGAGFTTAAATTYATGDVVQDGEGRWAFCDLGGTVTTPGGSYTAFGGTSTWVAYEGEKLIGATYYAFNIVIEGNGGTRGEIYEWAMRQLRKTVDINTGVISDVDQDTIGVVKGNVADELTSFRGSDLILEQGVFIDNFAATEINNLYFVPIPVDAGTPTEVNFPFEVVVTINLPTNVVGEVDADTRGTGYFTNDDAGDNNGDDFDTSGAIIVHNNTAGATVTFTNATDKVNYTAHPYSNGDRIMFENSGGALPTGLSASLVYFVVNSAANDFEVSLTEGGSAVDFTDDGSGTTDVKRPVDFDGADIAANAYTFSYDYDGNVQRGATSGGKPAPVTLQLCGLNAFEIGTTAFEISRVATLTVNVVAADERNYSNPP
jgi:hypothetical protein